MCSRRVNCVGVELKNIGVLEYCLLLTSQMASPVPEEQLNDSFPSSSCPASSLLASHGARVESSLSPSSFSYPANSPSSPSLCPPSPATLPSRVSPSPSSGTSSAAPLCPVYLQYLLPSSAHLVTGTQLDQQETEEACLSCYRSSFHNFFSSFSSSPPPFSFSLSPRCTGDHPTCVRETALSQEEKELTELQQSILSKDVARLRLRRESHVAYCLRHLESPLDKCMMELDASRCWLVFWTIHSLDLLDAFHPQQYASRMLRFFASSWDTSTGVGGWGGGPGQQAHLAPTYAAAASLLILDAVDIWLSSGMPKKGRKRSERVRAQDERTGRESKEEGGENKEDEEGIQEPQIAQEVGRPAPVDAGGMEETREKAKEMSKDAELRDGEVWGGEGERKEDEDARQRLYDWFLQVKNPEGGFCMHVDGEVDIRGTYCAVATASMLHMLTDELAEGVAEYVASCQTDEGGLAGEPGLEAHGGYTYCGLAALLILNKAHAVLDLDRLLHWAVHRQMGFEGGFQGRTHKLVDACYSFWHGGIFALLAEAFRQAGRRSYYDSMKTLWVSSDHLQYYILACCQDLRGGLRDKPGKRADLYHTCYALSGLSVAQHSLGVLELPPSSCSPAPPGETRQDGVEQEELMKRINQGNQGNATDASEDHGKRSQDKSDLYGERKKSSDDTTMGTRTSKKEDIAVATKKHLSLNLLARTDIFYNVRVDKVLSTRYKLLNHLPPFIEKRTGLRGSEGEGVVSYYRHYQIS